MKKSLLLVALIGLNACATTGVKRVSDERAPAYVANVQPEKPKSHLWIAAIGATAIAAVTIIFETKHYSNSGVPCTVCLPGSPAH